MLRKVILMVKKRTGRRRLEMMGIYHIWTSNNEKNAGIEKQRCSGPVSRIGKCLCILSEGKLVYYFHLCNHSCRWDTIMLMNMQVRIVFPSSSDTLMLSYYCYDMYLIHLCHRCDISLRRSRFSHSVVDPC